MLFIIFDVLLVTYDEYNDIILLIVYINSY